MDFIGHRVRVMWRVCKLNVYVFVVRSCNFYLLSDFDLGGVVLYVASHKLYHQSPIPNGKTPFCSYAVSAIETKDVSQL